MRERPRAFSTSDVALAATAAAVADVLLVCDASVLSAGAGTCGRGMLISV